METLQVMQGDITKVAVDAIVNAANSGLLGGGGVDGAIHRAGGQEILEACRVIRQQQGKLPTGQAVLTTAGLLPAKKVIHTVGPIWGQQSPAASDRLLQACYENSLELARNANLRTIAFPNISTGVYDFPKVRAAPLAIRATQTYLQQFPDHFERVIFVCFDPENFQLYQTLLDSQNQR